LKSGGPVIPSLSIPLSPHSLSSPVKIMGVRTPATLSVCVYEQRVVCNQNTQQIIDVSCLRKSAQIYGPACLRKNSSICCGVLRPLNLCDVCRACVYQVKVVFVKYPDECCPHGCARHARCCSDWLEMTHRGAIPTQLCAACPLLLRLAGNDSPRGDTDTVVRGMPVAAPTGWMGRWWGAAGGRSAVPCTGSAHCGNV